MLRITDSTFVLGSALAAIALLLAVAAILRGELPLLGGGAGALLAVALVGMGACAVGGISQAPAVGWGAPSILVGTVLGVAIVAIVAAGLFGWSGLLQPVGQLLSLPADTTPPARIALVALAWLLAAKWLVAAVMAVLAR
jgi:hypothetical protein